MRFRRNFLSGIFIFILFELEVCHGQCAGNEIIGLDDTQKRKNRDYDGSGVNAVMVTDDNYRFTCCGFIYEWEIYARNGPLVDVTAQVWYESGSTWNLRGENIITPTNANAENIAPVTNGNRVRVENNDRIGFYEPLGSMVTYDVGGGNVADFYTATFAAAQTSYNWDAATKIDKSEHAIHAKVQPSAAPVFTNVLPDTVTIFNTESVGSSLYQLTASDSDLEDAGMLTVSLVSATGAGLTYFEFDTNTLDVKVKATPIPGSYDLTFSVKDPCLLETLGVLTIVVDNNPPILDSLSVSNSVNISEDKTTFELLHTLQVTETDSYTCGLVSTGVPFEITTISGSTDYGIYLSNGASMDYDTQNGYVLDLSCTDAYGASTGGTFTVNLIENQPPTIHGLPRAVDIQEDTTIETTLYTIVTTDPTNDFVDCDVTSIVPSTTIVFLKPATNFNEYDIVLQSNPNLQYDVVRTYRLNIACADARTTVTNVFFVNVLRNRPPTFTNLQNITTVSSIGSAIGQIVFDVEVTDPENDQVTFTMSVNPSTNHPFKIYNSGEILLTRTVEGEFIPAYDLFVYVNDGYTTTGPRSLTVHILDINYVPVIRNLPLPSALVVSENLDTSLSIFQVFIQDNDESDIHSYSMQCEPSDGMHYFEINPTTGLITTSSVNNIDYETLGSSSYTFTVTVTDSKDSASKNLSISIANVNESPVFTKTSYVINTNEGTAASVLPDPGYLYTDEDTGDTHTFSMTCGSNGGSFSIAPSTGRISLATNVDVDAVGSATSYTCTVQISDGHLTDTATLTININNINDNTPQFANNLYTFYVAMDTPVNTVFGSALATDEDIGAYGTFVYSLNQASLGEETFGVQANGDLYLKNSLSSYSYGQSLSFTVQAVDTDGLTGTATVFVVIPQTTTTSTTSTTDRYRTFWEYPANPAWVVTLIALGIIICILLFYMIYRNRGSWTLRGRPGNGNAPKTEDKKDDIYRTATWKPWKWYQVQRL